MSAIPRDHIPKRVATQCPDPCHGRVWRTSSGHLACASGPSAGCPRTASKMALVFQPAEETVDVKQLGVARGVPHLSVGATNSDERLHARATWSYSMQRVIGARALPGSCPAHPHGQPGRDVHGSASRTFPAEATQMARAARPSMDATQVLGCSRETRPLISRVTRPVVLGPLLLSSAFVPFAVNAASVYKCPLPGQSVQYADLHCGGSRKGYAPLSSTVAAPARREARGVLMAARNEEPIRRNGVRHSLLANASRRSAPALADSYAGEQGQTPVLNRGNAPPVAYQCTAGSKVWIQTDPCPAIYLKDVREGVGDSTYDSLPERGPPFRLNVYPYARRNSMHRSSVGNWTITRSC